MRQAPLEMRIPSGESSRNVEATGAGTSSFYHTWASIAYISGVCNRVKWEQEWWRPGWENIVQGTEVINGEASMRVLFALYFQILCLFLPPSTFAAWVPCLDFVIVFFFFLPFCLCCSQDIIWNATAWLWIFTWQSLTMDSRYHRSCILLLVFIFTTHISWSSKSLKIDTSYLLVCSICWTWAWLECWICMDKTHWPTCRVAWQMVW